MSYSETLDWIMFTFYTGGAVGGWIALYFILFKRD